MRAFRARILAAGLGAGCCIVVAGTTPAFAQFGGGGGGVGGPTGINGAAQRNLKGAEAGGTKTVVAPPPVLPGTKSASEPAAPTEATMTMSPTEALFDAINRGDLTAARDAVNRGADVDGRSLLGLTPLDLSVDLGRNDISFMLLSQRGDDGAARRTARRGTDQAAADLAGRGASRTVSRPRATTVSAREPAEEAPSESPRLSSGNGGTPIPAAGFLGFDSRAAR
jgi:hypothetical protein